MNKERGLCLNCFYWNTNISVLQQGEGLCKRYPPAPNAPTKFLTARWPITTKDDGCGEWKKNEQGGQTI